MNVLELVQQRGLQTKKVSGRQGGEWAGPCPGCGGEDRFHVWPEQNNGGGSWWCRGCRQGGDAIQFLRVFDDMGYKEACQTLGRDPGRPLRRLRPHLRIQSKWHPHEYAAPHELWQQQAAKWVEKCHAALLENDGQLAYLAARGVTRAAVEKFRLGWIAKDAWRPRQQWGLPEEINEKTGKPKRLWIPAGIVIPWVHGGRVLRLRIRRPDGEPKYYVLPGSSSATWFTGRKLRDAVVVEAELDAIAVAVAAGDLVGACAVLTNRGKPDAETLPALRGMRQILVALDAEMSGAQGLAWWLETFPQAVTCPVPVGKDIGDYVMDHGGDLRLWVASHLPEYMVLPCQGSGGQPASGRKEVEGGDVDAPREKTKEARLAEAAKMLLHAMRSTGCQLECDPGGGNIRWRCGEEVTLLDEESKQAARVMLREAMRAAKDEDLLRMIDMRVHIAGERTVLRSLAEHKVVVDE